MADVFVSCVPAFCVGDPAPTRHQPNVSLYLARHEWARVQLRGGLRQLRCPKCGRWRFPQEACCSVSLKGRNNG